MNSQVFRDSNRWNRAIGNLWSEVLQRHNLNPESTIVEIGPGFTDKVAYGLAAVRFRGTVILIEPNPAAGAWAMQRYRQLLPHAEIQLFGGRMAATPSLRNRCVDALLSNHILDDLILSYAVNPQQSTAIFGNMKPGRQCSRFFIRTWQHLLERPEKLNSLIARVARDLEESIQALQPRLLLMNQYPSWQHNLCGLNSIHSTSLRLMHLLAKTLPADSLQRDVPVSRSGRFLVQWLYRLRQ